MNPTTCPTNTYRLAPAPRAAAMWAWDCAFCAHQDLTRPVFLEGPSGLVAAGSGCAAVALGYANTVSTRRQVAATAAQIEHAAAVAEELAEERRGRYARALVDFTARRDGVNVPDTADLLSCRRTYHQSGGFDGLGVLFPVFLAAVADTGALPEAKR